MDLIEKFFGKRISNADLQQRMAQGEPVLLLDVRTAKEFIGPEGRIPGAKSVPLRRLRAEAAETVQGFSGQIVTVCSHGLRSLLALRILRRLGVNAQSLGGGVLSWRRQGFEIIQDTPTPRRKAAKSC